jgi:hypothetical protein
MDLRPCSMCLVSTVAARVLVQRKANVVLPVPLLIVASFMVSFLVIYDSNVLQVSDIDQNVVLTGTAHGHTFILANARLYYQATTWKSTM